MIYVILGTRAQLVKMAPLIQEIEHLSWPLCLVHTGQHKEGVDDLCAEFSILKPWHYLYENTEEVKTPWHAVSWLLKMLVMIIFRPTLLLPGYCQTKNHLLLVHGDTFSTVVGAFLGWRLKAIVAHVESGLRSFNLFDPFPEELNRLATFRLADYAFCPGAWAVNNLRRYMNLQTIDTQSNTLLDTLRWAISSKNNSEYSMPEAEYGVVSLHRFENIFFQKKLTLIVEQLLQVSARYRLIFVLHPATKKRLEKTGLIDMLNNGNIEIRPRTTYFNFIRLLSNARFVISDGGSNQEELSYLNIPTFLMREVTERPEGLGQNIVLGGVTHGRLLQFVEDLPDASAVNRALSEHSPSRQIAEYIGRILHDSD